MAIANAEAKDIKVGIILGFTGPIESLTPDMAAGAELAFAEANQLRRTIRWINHFCKLRADAQLALTQLPQ